MTKDQIPNAEKYNTLAKLLADAEPLALELASDKVHSQSGHIAAALGRIRAARENLTFHDQFLAVQAAPTTVGQASSLSPSSPEKSNE